MTTQEQEQFDSLTKESIKLAYEIHKELGYYLLHERCPTTDSVRLAAEKIVQLQKISTKIAWLTAPACMKEL